MKTTNFTGVACALLAAAAAVVSAGSAMAQETESPTAAAASLKPPTEQDAPKPEGAWSHQFTYTADVTGALQGGRKQAGRYLDNLDIIIDGDLEKLVGWRGAKAHFYFLNNTGGQPNDIVGSLQGVDNIEVSRPKGRLYELWLQQSLPGDRGSVLLGLYNLNSEFYATDASGLLMGPTFGIGSELAATGPNGPSIFPMTAFAVRLKLGGDTGGYAQAAVLSAHAGSLEEPHPSMGLDRGAILIGEAGWRGRMHLGAGVWTYSERQNDLYRVDASGEPLRVPAHGGYVMAEGPLRADHPATTAFFRAGVSDAKTTPYKGGWQAGIKAVGVIAGRPDSAFSVGVQQAWLSNGQTAASRDGGVDPSATESGVEFVFTDRVGRFQLRPDLQILRHPGGDAGRGTAIVGALRLIIDLG